MSAVIALLAQVFEVLPNVEDHFLAASRAVGTMLEPHVKPAEIVVTELLNKHVPAFLPWYVRSRSPHTESLSLMNPVHVLFAILAYVTVIFIGIAVMKPLPKFKLTWFAFFHNVFLTALSAYMSLKALVYAKQAGYSLFSFGNSVDHSPAGFPMAKIVWLFYISKVYEFLDTVIMVLKKNNRQISFLHMYHHGSILAVQWLVLMWAPGGESMLPVVLNSFIHVVMYGYYLLSSMGFKSVSLIKRYITTMQMTQFCILFVQGVFDYYIPTTNPEATNYPPQLAIMLMVYMITMLALFGNFFIQDKRRADRAKLEAKLNNSKKTQ
ncbi:GNS1/SUR4 family-domain-containing protein [Entophlyctis helioformis]|nr:GNS1/SUR4 family-domain-containing protein [Entophlyctis helioformis]